MATRLDAADPAGASKALHDFLATEWDYTLEQNPTWASDLGDRRFNDLWQDLTPRAIGARAQHDVIALGTMHDTINRASLPPADQLDYDLYERQLKTAIEGRQFRFYLCPLNQRGGVQNADDILNNLRVSTPEDYEDWLARLARLPDFIQQTTDLMRQGMHEKILLPKVVMGRVPAQIAKQVVDRPEDSPFYKPFRAFPASFSDEQKRGMSERAAKAIREGIVPAYREFQKFFESEYLPACYDGVGVWQMPEGKAAYAYFARQQTTTLTPEQIHQIGLDEVARIHGEMETVMAQVGFKGTMPEFFTFLRTDPQFFFKTPEELLAAYKVQAKTTDPLLVKLFKTLPRLSYGVEPIPAALAPDTTTAYYRPGSPDAPRAGYFCVNLYRPETRPKWEMTALALHESVPGHHLQIALAQELGELPPFRRNGSGDYTAFVEGWALYAEFLGEEMGEYHDPYAKFGELTYEMWRAVRLVVDTGIHFYHWDRQQAIDYFMANAPKTELDVTNEVDRYIAWPGQALAYKIGQLKIKELRARATKELGPGFDVREFHDAVLGGGALPLDVLERRIDEWIAQEKAAAAKAKESAR